MSGRIIGLIGLFGAFSALAGNPRNLAPLAIVDGPGQHPEAAVDGIRQQDGSGEWVGESPNTWYGWITYPKPELKWDASQTINKVVLYDRPTIDEHMAACVLKFSDGSEEHVFAVPNDGSPRTVVFEAREVTGLNVEVVDGIGSRIGLSEIEVYHGPAAKPDTRRKKTFSDYVSYVDPMIETGRGRWFFCTPGSRPFGMVCASAYTRNKNQGGGGYNYNSTEFEDYLAGEVNWHLPVSGLRPWDGKEYYQGTDIAGDPRFPDELVVGWAQHINNHGGTISWDVPLSDSGMIPEKHMAQLRVLSRSIGGDARP